MKARAPEETLPKLPDEGTNGKEEPMRDLKITSRSGCGPRPKPPSPSANVC